VPPGEANETQVACREDRLGDLPRDSSVKAGEHALGPRHVRLRARATTDHPTLMPKQEQDRNDGKQWLAAGIEDLELALKDGVTIEAAAHFLCHGGSLMMFADR
jgi:hypothetical protein